MPLIEREVDRCLRDLEPDLCGGRCAALEGRRGCTRRPKMAPARGSRGLSRRAGFSLRSTQLLPCFERLLGPGNYNPIPKPGRQRVGQDTSDGMS